MIQVTNFIKLDFNRSNDITIPTIEWDQGSRFVRVQLQNNNQNVDITGSQVVITVIRNDLEEIIESCNLIDAKEGIIEFEISKSMVARQGDMLCQLKLSDNDSLLSSQLFKISVNNTLMVSLEESRSEMNVLIHALGEVQNIDNRFAQTNAQLSTKANKDDVAKISSGTPLFASSVSEMTDITKNYVNLTDGFLYIHNGSIFEKSNVRYQSSGIDNGFIVPSMLSEKTDIYSSVRWQSEKANILNYNQSLSYNNQSSISQYFIIDKPLPKSLVTNLSAKLFGSNRTLNIALFKKTSDNEFLVLDKKDIGVVSGTDDYLVDISIDENDLYIGIKGTVLYATATAQNGGYSFYDLKQSAIEIGNSYTVAKSSMYLNFGLKLDGFMDYGLSGKALDERLVAVENELNNEVVLFNQSNFFNNFTFTRADWVYTNCSPNNGIRLMGYSKAYLNKYLALDRWCHRGIVRLNSLSSVFGLVNNHTVKGAVYLVDNVSKTINIYEKYTGGNSIPAVKASTSLSFDLELNTDYILEILKDGWKHTFSIIDPKSLKTTKVEFDNELLDSTAYSGKGWGYPGVICFSGDVTFRNHTYSAENINEADILFIGDSITEGTNIKTAIENRWCSQLRDKFFTNKKVLIAGRGGDTTTGIVQRLNELYNLGLKTKVVVVLIGTNQQSSSGYATWENEIVQIYDLITRNNAIPVICIPPIPSDETYILKMRDFVLSKNWNTIRFDYATSLNRDGINYDGSMFTDSIHPSLKGCNAMYDQATIDLSSIIF